MKDLNMLLSCFRTKTSGNDSAGIIKFHAEGVNSHNNSTIQSHINFICQTWFKLMRASSELHFSVKFKGYLMYRARRQDVAQKMERN